MKQTVAALVVLISMILTAYAQTTSVPPLINYQGRLTDAHGTGLSGTKKLEFNIYDNVDAGNVIWGPQTFLAVPVVDGYFNVILGTTDATGRSIAAAFDSGDRYLGIKVEGANEISPRQQILSAPYALQAGKVSHHSNIIPVGTIASYWGDTAPPGWLMCNGAAIPQSAEYNTLRSLVGGNTPDLRGVFLRGLDNGRGLDPSRAKGSLQSDDFKSHDHTFSDYYYSETFCGGGSNMGSGDSDHDNSPCGAFSHNTDLRGGSETRPKNVAVNFIIKF